jgi:Flp pilus assembly protein TadD
MHMYDPHAPYRPPSPYREAFREHPYDGEIAYADSQLGRVVDTLRTLGLSGRTITVVLGDHGESLGEHGEATHAVLIYEATLHVPLLMSGPDIPEGRTVASRVGTVDVVPTILGLLHLAPPQNLAGRDLRPAFSGGSAARESLYGESLFGRLNCRWSSLRSLTDGDWKLINGAKPELYDLARDPGETENRAEDERDRTERMLRALQAALGVLAPAGDTAHAVAITAEQQERLRSLGYAGGGGGGGGSLDEPGLPDPRERVKLYESLVNLLATPPDAAPRAADAASEAAAADPGNPFAQFTVASLAYHAGEFRRADVAFRRCLDLDPDRPTIRAYHAQLLRDLGRLDESENELRIVLAQAAPDDLRVRINLAETLILARKYEEARALLDYVLGKAPHHIEALGAMGRLLLAEDRGKEAIPYLKDACRANEIEPWIELASGDLQIGDGNAAREAASHALSLSPKHPWALAVLGHALILEGKSGEGVSVLHEALSLGPRRPRVWRSLALGFAAAGDAPTARRCREAADAASRG